MNPRTHTSPGRWSATLVATLAAALAMTMVPLPADANERDADRIDGANRYETATMTAFHAFEPDEVDTVYLATGGGFADALAAGACAAAQDAPVLLTAPSVLPDETVAAFAEDVVPGADTDASDVWSPDEAFSPSRIVVAGGQNAIGDDALSAFTGGSAQVDRLAGDTRYHTAANLATDCFDSEAVDTVYVATGAGFADALGAVPAAARDGAPLLLTGPQGLHAAAIDALAQLQPERIVLVGGTAALSQGVVDGLEGQGFDDITRIAGNDRFSTAAQVARTAFDQADAAYIATGGNFADALGGGAAAAHLDVPLLLTRPDYVPAVVRQALGELGVSHTTVLGGEAAIGGDVQTDLDADLPDFAYASYDSSSQHIYVGEFDGTTRRVSDRISGVYDLNPLFSRDGTQVAFTRARQIGGEWVGEMAATGMGSQAVETLSDFGEDLGCEVAPWDWNAAGDTIAWTCSISDGPTLAGTSTLGGEVVTFEPEGEGHYAVPQFLPNGDIMVVRTEEDQPTELRRLDPTSPNSGGELMYESDADRPLWSARLSPDGSQVAVRRPTPGADHDAPLPTVTLLVIDVDTGDEIELLDGEEHGGDEPGPHSLLDWHPDGDRLLVGTGGFGEGQVVRFLDTSTGDLDPVLGEADIASGRTVGNAAVSPDGAFVLYSETNVDHDFSYTIGNLYRVNTDGSGKQHLDQAGNRASSVALNHAAFR